MRKVKIKCILSILFVCFASSLRTTSIYAKNNENQVFEQNSFQVKGKILDVNKEPLIGVSIVEKGTTNGTITTLDGDFILTTSSSNAVLVISYVGFKQVEVLANEANNTDIVLQEDITGLEEVIVVAYGTAKKASFTGSATVINSSDFEKAQPINLTQGLQGRSPGLQIVNSSGAPGANSSILIRGLGSITASNDPLFVVDGVPYAGDLNTISPTEIESITVLKDAASTTLYGSRAGNGVILITTKKGKPGKIKVNFNANWGTSDFAVDFPKKSSPERQYELTFEGLYNDAMDFMLINDKPYTDAQARQYAHDNVTRIYWLESNTALSDGSVRKYLSDWNTDYPVGLDGKIKPDAKRLYNYDVYKESFKRRVKQDYSVDISGGLGDKSTFFASFSLLNDKGIFVGEQYKRASGRVQLTTKVNERITLDNSINYITSTDYNISTPFRAFRNFPTVYSAFIWDHNTNDYAVSPYTGSRILDVGEQSRTWWKGWSAFGYLVENTKNKTDQVFAKTSATVVLFPFLTYRVSYGYDYVQRFNSWSRSPERGANLKPGDGLVNRDGNRYNAHTLTNTLTFDKTIDKHHFNVLGGAEIYNWRNDVWSSGRRGLAMVGMTEQSSASGAATAYSYNDQYRLASFLSRAEYDYADKYYITGSYRTDGSSRFHKDNRWGNFWSIGGSWRVTQEEFMQSASHWLNNLKLKFSYGEVGNDNVSLYAYQSLYGPNNYYGESGATLSRLPTPDVKWETNVQANIGLEMTLFEKLNFSFELYRRKSKDLLMNKPIPYSLGKSSYLANIGDIKNDGWELQLDYYAMKLKDFDWSISFNVSGYKNKITSLPMGEEIRTDHSLTYKWKVGGSLYDIYAPLWAGVDPETGRNTWYKLQLDENDNIVNKEVTKNYADVTTTDQYVKVGSSLPKAYGGITNNFRYKDFDLSFMFYYSVGAKYYDSHYAESSQAFGANASTKFTENRWTTPGEITSVPKLYAEHGGTAYSIAYSSQYLYKNNFLRLRNLTLGYTVPKKIISKCGIESLRLFFVGENLWTIGKAQKHGTDPENVGIGGIVGDYSGLPIRKTFSLGLNIQF